MALSIKTAEADDLVRQLVELTGETLTEAVTVALRERLDRERARMAARPDFSMRVLRLAREIGANYDRRTVTKEEWDAASGDEA